MTSPNKTQVLHLLESTGHPQHLSEIIDALGVDVLHIRALLITLGELHIDNKVQALSGHRYMASHPMPTVVAAAVSPFSAGAELEGTVSVHPKGFGFVAIRSNDRSEPRSPDVFVPRERLAGALFGDRVRVRVLRESDRGPEGEILGVVSRNTKRLTGTLRIKRGSVWLEPDDQRMRSPIVIEPLTFDEGIEDRAFAVAEITRFPELHDELVVAKVVSVFAARNPTDHEVRKILAVNSIEEPFSSAVEEAAKALDCAVPDRPLRENLAHIPFVTIDPKDARDHDDAVWVGRPSEEERQLYEGKAAYIVYVAIADVSAFVTEGSLIDAAAFARGCSIYLPDRAIPMLPRSLSSDLCSLLPNVERSAMVVREVLNATGDSLSVSFPSAVIQSRAKIAYEEAASLLGFIEEPLEDVRRTELDTFVGDLKVAWECSSLLRSRRTIRGSLDFDLPEAKVVLDGEGQCVNVVSSRANPKIRKAYNLIEELMLLANEKIAEMPIRKGAPAIYRIHERPDKAKLETLKAACSVMGLTFELESAAHPKTLSKILAKMHKLPKGKVLESLLLRAMKQARYSAENLGHYGLASQAYLHFTSPIRRYPDIVAHRALKAMAAMGLGSRHDFTREPEEPEDATVFRPIASLNVPRTLSATADQCSDNERRAMVVEREVVDLHRAVLMQKHIGELIEGTVSGFSGAGVYVSIEEPYVDILVRFEALGPGGFTLDEVRMCAVALSSKGEVALGDSMLVRVLEASIERRIVYGERVRVTESEPVAKKPKRTEPVVEGPSEGRTRSIIKWQSRSVVGDETDSGVEEFGYTVGKRPIQAAKARMKRATQGKAAAGRVSKGPAKAKKAKKKS